mmetsp:Transcript_176621/g.566320  ORF Transcript_176621/g.566320 Transcript_176621/m.566320 type:complete len:158 (+) Transcript_176621:169-642(+)
MVGCGTRLRAGWPKVRLWLVRLLCWAPVAVAQEPLAPGSRIEQYLGVDFRALCLEPEALVAVRQPLCWNATTPPWFPARVVAADPKEGTLKVVFGWEVFPEARWVNETDLQVSDVKVVPCLDQWPAGEVGRGYAYLPECDHSDGVDHGLAATMSTHV